MSTGMETALPVSVIVSHGGMAVQLSPRDDLKLKVLDAPAIISHLARIGVQLDSRGEAEVHEFCRPRKSPRPLKPITVARGVACIHDVPALLDPIRSPLESPFEPRHVRAGDAVARLVARKVGHDGVDVFGKPVPRRTASVNPTVDPSIVSARSGNLYLAAIDGVVRIDGSGPAQKLSIVPCLRHDGNISGTALRTRGEIWVSGDVNDAALCASGSIQISGSIEKTSSICEKDFAAAKVLQSRVTAGGAVEVQGAIVGGHIIATAGLRCGTLGAADLTKTLVEIGINDQHRRRLAIALPQIEERLAKAQAIRSAVEPLLRQPQPLTTEQRSKLDAVLTEADATEKLARTQRDELRAEHDAVLATCRYEINVEQMVHAGVTIRFPSAQTMVRIAIGGPCRIFLDGEGDQLRILLQRGSDKPVPLEITKLEEDWRSAAKLLAA